MNKVGLRSEDKHWESRVSIGPDDIPTLPQNITITIQNEVDRTIPFKPRVFSNEAYMQAGSEGGARNEVQRGPD